MRLEVAQRGLMSVRAAQSERRNQLKLMHDTMHDAAAPTRDPPADRQNFGKMLLVFGYIGTDLCK